MSSSRCWSSWAYAIHVVHHFKSLTLWLIVLTPALLVTKWHCNVNLWEAVLLLFGFFFLSKKKDNRSWMLYWRALIFRGHWRLTRFTYSYHSEHNRQRTKTHIHISKFPWVFLLSLIIILYWPFIALLKLFFLFLSPKQHKQMDLISHFFFQLWQSKLDVC